MEFMCCAFCNEKFLRQVIDSIEALFLFPSWWHFIFKDFLHTFHGHINQLQSHINQLQGHINQHQCHIFSILIIFNARFSSCFQWNAEIQFSNAFEFNFIAILSPVVSSKHLLHLGIFQHFTNSLFFFSKCHLIKFVISLPFHLIDLMLVCSLIDWFNSCLIPFSPHLFLIVKRKFVELQYSGWFNRAVFK